MVDDRGGSAPPPYRVILPVGPAVEDGAARAAELGGQAATIQALLAPTAQQGRDGEMTPRSHLATCPNCATPTSRADDAH